MIILAMPAYNEAPNLARLLPRVREIRDRLTVPIRVIVVDDGSTDDTAAVARRAADGLDVEVVPHGQNQGLAATIKTALSSALTRATSDDDIIVTMDADDTHTPALIPGMAALVDEGYDLVVASRFTPGARVSGLSLPRKIYSLVAAWAFRLITPMRGVRDYTCGYRAYRAGFLRRVWAVYGDAITTETGFSCMADILLKCREFRPVAAEVPLDLRYDRKEGASKMRVWATISATLRMLARAAFQGRRRENA